MLNHGSRISTVRERVGELTILDVKHGSRISTVRGRVGELTMLDVKPWL